MPEAVNGIGTWYYGKKNITETVGTCEFCGNQAKLTSYDTTLYIIVLFIPIVPLGKKRIIDQCSSCTKHRALKLHEWNELKRKALEETSSRYRSSPGDAKATSEYISALSTFQVIDDFIQIAPDVRRNHANNGEVLELLTHVSLKFGLWEDAASAAKAALDLEDTSERRELLAYVLIKTGKPDEAAYYLNHCYSADAHDKLGYLVDLVEAYQAAGEHRKAIQVMDQCSQIHPTLKQDKTFKKMRKKSEKNLHSGKKIVPKAGISGDVKFKEGSSTGNLMAKLIGPIILIALLALYVFFAWKAGQSREVFIVNGLPKAYKVTVNDTPYTLNPYSSKRVSIKEGEVTVKVPDDTPYKIDDLTVEIKTSFLIRPFLDKTFVINPDRSAAILWEKIFYTAEDNLDNAPEGESKYYVAQDLYEFNGIDYPFESFPESLKVSSSGSTPREGLFVINPQEEMPYRTLVNISEDRGIPEALAFAAMHLNHEPEDSQYLQFVSEVMKPELFVQFVRPFLEKRPVLVPWHRNYQNIKTVQDPDFDIQGEYKTLLDAEPENKSLLYLYGRILDDTPESLKYFQKSAEGDDPSPWGAYALGFNFLTMGEFEKAVEWTGKACDLKPEDSLYSSIHISALAGAEHFDEALELINKHRTLYPNEPSWFLEEMRLQVIKGDREAAKDVVDRAIRKFVHKGTVPLYAKTLKNYFNATLAYYLGDFDKMVELAGPSDPVDIVFSRAVSLGNLEEAKKNLAAMALSNDATIDNYLTLYVAQMQAGKSDEADDSLSAAVLILKDGGPDAKKSADWLEGNKTPNEENLLYYASLPRHKAIYLTALGMERPDLQKIAFPLATKLNFSPAFPHHLIKEVIEGKKPAGLIPVE